jgi:hypothetical protein
VHPAPTKWASVCAQCLLPQAHKFGTGAILEHGSFWDTRDDDGHRGGGGGGTGGPSVWCVWLCVALACP